MVPIDLVVVAALVSPVGNLLTGGDLVKSLLYILLLLFCFHQLIKVSSIALIQVSLLVPCTM